VVVDCVAKINVSNLEKEYTLVKHEQRCATVTFLEDGIVPFKNPMINIKLILLDGSPDLVISKKFSTFTIKNTDSKPKLLIHGNISIKLHDYNFKFLYHVVNIEILVDFKPPRIRTRWNSTFDVCTYIVSGTIASEVSITYGFKFQSQLSECVVVLILLQCCV